MVAKSSHFWRSEYQSISWISLLSKETKSYLIWDNISDAKVVRIVRCIAYRSIGKDGVNKSNRADRQNPSVLVDGRHVNTDATIEDFQSLVRPAPIESHRNGHSCIVESQITHCKLSVGS